MSGDGSRNNDPARERDFYLRLLDLGAAAEPEPLLERALATIVEASGAHAAYIEFHGQDDQESSPRYWKAHGCSEDGLAAIRASISRGIIARTLAEGRTVGTPSAVADPEFRDQPSVLRNSIQAVLCTPIGQPALGVVYLQGPRADDRFAARNCNSIEVFARQLATVADRLLTRRALAAESDPTLEIRRAFRCPALVGRSAAFATMLREAAQVAPLPISVLISGASGTGKSALAHAIAANSPRASGPYVDLNCAALPDALLEAELFGAEAGAYTGATKRQLGKVAAARGGTLFLDEIAELSLPAQAKLLQLLQERRYYPLGSTTPVIADVRVISASNADLKSRIAQRTFREDLYYRLAVLPIRVPTLDERRDDIPELVERYCAETCERHAVSPIRPTRRALWACREAPWPGNVRELSNAVEAAVARAAFDKALTLDEHHLFPSTRPSDAPLTFREATQRSQRRYLEDALVRNDWNITRTAVELDLSRQHVHDLLATFGLCRPDES